MKDLPFSVYDFLVSIGSGAALLFLVDFAFGIGWFQGPEPRAFGLAGWAIACYTAGHIVAQFSGWLLEDVLLQRVLKRDESTIFLGATGWRPRLFPRLFRVLPIGTQERVLGNVPASLRSPGPALFNHCFAAVKRDPIAFSRMNTFQVLYGFARNICFVSVLASIIYAFRLAMVLMHGGQRSQTAVAFLTVAAFIALMMFYRYLNFFWRYSHELYVTYAGFASWPAEGTVESPACVGERG